MSAPIYRGIVGRAPMYGGIVGRAPIYRSILGRAPIYRGILGRAPIHRGILGRAPIYQRKIDFLKVVDLAESFRMRYSRASGRPSLSRSAHFSDTMVYKCISLTCRVNGPLPHPLTGIMDMDE